MNLLKNWKFHHQILISGFSWKYGKNEAYSLECEVRPEQCGTCHLLTHVLILSLSPTPTLVLPGWVHSAELRPWPLWAFGFATTALVNAIRLKIGNRGIHDEEEEIKKKSLFWGGIFAFLFFIMILIFFCYSWFTVFCQFSTAQQGDPVTHICIHSFFSYYHAPSQILNEVIANLENWTKLTEKQLTRIIWSSQNT